MERGTLIERASKIIHSAQPNRRDMVELSRIEFDMAVCASSAWEIASAEEESYNLKKSEVTLEEKGRKKPITEAVEIWRYVAEKEHWCYRGMKQKSKDMWGVVESVRWFKISVYSSEKENDEMQNNWYSIYE